MTHCHKDHLDDTAVRLLPRDVPVFCQPEDEERLRAVGLDARPVDESLEWNGLTLHRVPAQHGHGAVAEALAPVSGFVLDDLYLAGDTVWYRGASSRRSSGSTRGSPSSTPAAPRSSRAG